MAASLIFYNPRKIASLDRNLYPDINRFSKFFSLYDNSVALVDRTGTVRTPIRSHLLSPIPAVRPFSKTYEELCDERAREILQRADELSLPIYTMWSGGIDSTLVLVSLLKHATETQKKNITVLMSDESINEYPRFYREHIYGKLHTESSVRFPELIGTNLMLVGGEHNDQLFGSDVVGLMISRYGEAIIHEPVRRDRLLEFFTEKSGNAENVDFYLDIFEKVRASAPVEISTNFQYLWWLNFALKWQPVYTRMLIRVRPRNVANITPEYLRTRYVQFYSTDDFQLWSILNLDKKIQNTWVSYKFTAKEVIYRYTKDADYRDNKTKRGSLFNLLVQQDMYNFVDDSFTFYKEMEPEEYYLPENDFA
ncbi:MAG: hypothetical protein P4L81_01810 [Candidatus Pacebacteria bacterium]|nr:hypothetical protein [Candidatus Paceibacterota bacterium]